MTNQQKPALAVPYLPTDIPFSGEQKQWMGGFLAGLHTRLHVNGGATAAASVAAPVAQKPVMILFGSQTGNAEDVAEQAADFAREAGLAPQVLDMDDVSPEQLVGVERLLIVTSTYGEGEMPDNAQSLWDAMSGDDAPALAGTFFSVLALGDTNYDEFCVAGKMWDARLAELGAERIYDRVDCDVDFDTPAANWIQGAVPIIAQKGSEAAGPVAATASSPKKAKSKFGRNNPLPAKLLRKAVLTQQASSKEIVHYEFSLAGSGETYEAGDALNVIVKNRPDLVEELCQILNIEAGEIVNWQGEVIDARTLLSERLEIRTPSKAFIAEIANQCNDPSFRDLINSGDNEAMSDFLWGKDCVDLLNDYGVSFSAEVFCNLCKAMAPRAYSISSSINAHPEEVHLTIGSVRYHQDGRDHAGVCSTYLADIAEEGDEVLCYFAPNKNFSVPEDSSLPMIMVGPGTGIAPFRAFLEEREATGASGDNWLFFGDRNRASDFIYEDEITAMQNSGVLTRLDLAFSRDQAEKLYVQDRMKQQGAELFAWFERGAYFFICGDAYRMAKDVDKALHEIIAEHGNMSAEQAADYVEQLKKQKRYVRDVY